MRTTTPQHLSELQKNPKNIRNICILAHVDHGKTTIADALVASNGIISQRLAGKLRYMDSREDEQIRGITMKSSGISLHFSKESEEYLVNLIDTPGHVDFSSEVSTAVRLCDGALVVVDVVEGVCPQTHAVLRQAWLENIRPCLVLNKIDRLITELKYSPVEAHIHIQQILEKVNAITGTLFSSDVLEKSSAAKKASSKLTDCENQTPINNKTAVSIDDWSSGLDEVDDSSLYFSPELGNVLFVSAIDGWGFSIGNFAELYAEKLGIKADILKKTLWGDYFLHSKSKRIFNGAQAKAKKPLFVQFILENIWTVYDALLISRDKMKTEQIVKSLNLKISARDSRHTDARVYLRAIYSKWLPLSSALLSMVVEKLPSPLEMSEDRIKKLMCSGLRTFDSLPEETQKMVSDFQGCSSSENSPVILFVSKMFAVDEHALPKHRRRPLTHEEIAERRQQARQRHAELRAASALVENGTSLGNAGQQEQEQVDSKATESTAAKNHFTAFARVYSGTIRQGQQLYILGPKHDPHEALEILGRDPKFSEEDSMGRDSEESVVGLSVARSVDRGTDRNVARFTVQDLYLLMGRELEIVDSVPVGNILGIGGLENYVLKSATISSTVVCPPFTALPIEARPIVRVAVEPVHPADMPALGRGMRLLNQADPCVETLVQDTGEHVIIGAGEVHLQRCIDDLRERFACIELDVSDPIVPFRETVIEPPKTDMVNEAVVSELNLPAQTRQPAAAAAVGAENDEASSPGVVNRESGLIEIMTANKLCRLHIRVMSLPPAVVRLLDEKVHVIKMLVSLSSAERKEHKLKETTREELVDFYQQLSQSFKEAGTEWEDAADRIWAFGPRRVGPNILLNGISDYERPSIWHALRDGSFSNCNGGKHREYDNSIVSGFQLATLAGPLCQEPLMGVCFVVENWDQTSQTGSSGQTGSQIIDINENPFQAGNPEPSMDISKFEDDSLRIFDQADTDLIRVQLTKPDEVDKSKFVGEGKFENESAEEEIIGQGRLVELRGSQSERFSDGSEDISRRVGRRPGSKAQDQRIRADQRNAELGNDAKSSEGTETARHNTRDRYGPFSGQLMSAMKEGSRRAFQLQPMRLMAAMYTCQIQTPADVLGRMYGVISKREGTVLSEEMKEGSDVFDVIAVLPVAESFGFAEEIRKKTSGLANPQLVFSHWEVIDMDPFWVPTTEEEYTHFGEKADSQNQTRKYMNSVRRRKGLYVDEKTVEHAEKQRTLKK